MTWRNDKCISDIYINISEKELEKGKQLASKKDFEINHHLMDANNLTFENGSFDIVFGGAILHHLDINNTIHHIHRVLKPGGKILVEGFSKKQLGLNSGGPKNIDWLFSSKELETEFPGVKIILNEEKQRILDEGPLHQGLAEVVQFIAQK